MSESKELTVVERAALALGADEGEKQLIALAQKYTDITDIKNPAGRTQCHAAAMELSNARIAVDKTGKAAREDANAFQKAVIAEVARRVAIIKPEEDRLLEIRDAWDAEREREKQAKAAAEQARINAIKARIEAFMLDAVSAIAGTVAEIDAYATRLSETVISLDEFCEYAGEAQVKRDNTVKWLRERQQHAIAQEAEAARIDAEREAIERQRAELAEQERLAAVARAEQEAKDRAERLRVEAEQRAAQEKATAELRTQQEAHAKLVREQQAEIARQQAAIDAERQRQADEAARVERERQAAIDAEAARVASIERQRREAEEAGSRAEAERIERERVAAVMESMRREQEKFAMNGPGDVEIVKCLAHQYDVTAGDVMGWMKKFNYESADEKFAAMNATGNLQLLDQAA